MRKLIAILGCCVIAVAVIAASAVTHKGTKVVNSDTGKAGWQEPTGDFIDKKPVSASSPGADQVLKWIGGTWIPATDETGAGTDYWTLTGSSLYPNDLGWNVGIGTAPAQKLDVNGNVKISGGIHDGASLGSAGQVLKSDGVGDISWAADDNSGGTVTEITANEGLSATPNPITGIGTVGIADGGVTTVKIANDNVTLAKLAHGADGKVIKMVGSAPTWADDETGGSGTVTSISAGSGITCSPNPIIGTGTVSHTDASSQASVSNPVGTVIEDVGLDWTGHVTSLTSRDLGSLYDDYDYWGLQANGGAVTNISSGETVNFASGTNVSVTRLGNTIEISSTAGTDDDWSGAGSGTMYATSTADRVSIGHSGGSTRIRLWPTATAADEAGIAARGGGTTTTHTPPTGKDAAGLGTGQNYGWYGIAKDADGQGVVGLGSGKTTLYVLTGGCGVQGRAGTYGGRMTSESSAGYGLYATNIYSGTSDGYGVYGVSDNADYYGYGGYFIGGYKGVYGVANDGFAGVYGSDGATSTSYGVYYSGALGGTGKSSALLRTSKGPVEVYYSASTEVCFEDCGSGRLNGGRVHIELDPLYLETVTITNEHPVKVYIQLTDDCNGVYVKKGTTDFDVIELNDGSSNASFDYRVVAKRKNFENKRLEFTRDGYADAYLYPDLSDPEIPADIRTKRIEEERASKVERPREASLTKVEKDQ